MYVCRRPEGLRLFYRKNHNRSFMKIPRFIRHSCFYIKLKNTAIGRKYLIHSKKVIPYSKVDDYLSVAPVLKMTDCINKPFVGIVKDGFCFGDYVDVLSSWIFYERFLKNNDIRYGFYDIYSHDWLEKAEQFDLIVWRAASTPEDMYIAESKIYILENILHKKCFPSFHEVWQYEDKNRSTYLYHALNIPCIPTLISNSKSDALQASADIKYPFISKVHIGSASSGVKKINTKRQAIRYINKIFSLKGAKTVYPYLRQKDYFFMQEFIKDATFDLRIIIIGDKAFGYYRYPDKGDFRASGAGNYEKKDLPEEAIRLAIDIKKKLNSRLMGIDFLYSNHAKQYFVIETSLFNQIDTPEQLVVDGVAGYYDISSDRIVFKEGKFWIQELLMQLLVEEWCLEFNK